MPTSFITHMFFSNYSPMHISSSLYIPKLKPFLIPIHSPYPSLKPFMPIAHPYFQPDAYPYHRSYPNFFKK